MFEEVSLHKGLMDRADVEAVDKRARYVHDTDARQRKAAADAVYKAATCADMEAETSHNGYVVEVHDYATQTMYEYSFRDTPRGEYRLCGMQAGCFWTDWREL